MTASDRLRIENAVLSYSLWLDLRGVPARRRRDLSRELRANLYESAARTGGRSAVRALGGTRQMAAQVGGDADPGQPRWSAGGSAAAAALAVVLFVELLVGLGWVDGAMAGSPDRAVSGSLFPFPGSALQYTPQDDGGFAFTVEPGWACLVVALAVFVVVARPWRAVTRRFEDRLADPSARS